MTYSKSDCTNTLELVVAAAVVCAARAAPPAPRPYQPSAQLQQINPLDDHLDPSELHNYYSEQQQQQKGLAVIGDLGLVASRPNGTAVATFGLVLGPSPVGGIAGTDPAALNIDYLTYQAKSKQSPS